MDRHACAAHEHSNDDDAPDAEQAVQWLPVAPGDAAWTRDDASAVCPACGRMFTLLRRRHHCRRCGALACAGCAPAGQSQLRVCRVPCAAAHPKPQASSTSPGSAALHAAAPAPATAHTATPTTDDTAVYTLPDAYTSLPLGAGASPLSPPVMARGDIQLERELGRGCVCHFLCLISFSFFFIFFYHHHHHQRYFGVVYEAQTRSGRVAVKMLGGNEDAAAHAAFLREAERLWQVRHEHIVAVIGLVRHPQVPLGRR